MQHIVHRVFTGWIAKSVEEPKRKVAAGINGETNLGDQVIGCGRRLGTANWAGDVGIADTELVIIRRVGAEVLGFHLFQSVSRFMLHTFMEQAKQILTFRV